ncbi:proline-rich protein 33-like [Alligator sinensis]|uniref:Proline-rich protein 33-like n=1 Tax=Alligator sinensis TaxID=38654 RepID=A0A1U7S2R0_ALLSI|nr:proline-rich protein 33-like [Alligator sinensis]
MLITVTPPHERASLHPQTPPPPILPKPGKDNLRLQRLLKKAAKKATLGPQQAKLFRSSLSPVSEASPDLEHSDRSSLVKTPETSTHLTINLPPRFSIKPIIHHVPTPFLKSKPFTFTVTEQRSISEHLKLTVSPAPSPVHRQGTPESVMPSQLPHPQTHSVFVFPEPPVSVTPVITEAPVEVAHVSKVHTYFHSVPSPRPKTPLSDQVPKPLSDEMQRPLPTPPETSHSGQTPVSLNTGEAQTATPKSEPSILPSVTVELPYQAPRPATPKEPGGDSSPRAKTPDAQCKRPATPKSDMEKSKTEQASKPHETHSESLKPPPSSAAQKQDTPVPVMTSDTTRVSSTEAKEEHIIPPQPTAAFSSAGPLPKAEPTLPSVDKSKPPRVGLRGWSRLKKHLIVEPEEPKFPEPEPAMPKQEEEGKKKSDLSQGSTSQDRLVKPRATRMWDAILYQMTTSKMRKQQDKDKGVRKVVGFPFRCHLPLLLHRPRFDARKLKELASKPMTRITTVFELSLLHRKPPEEDPKNFNRTASGWQIN